jgi:hypothetical protein
MRSLPDPLVSRIASQLTRTSTFCAQIRFRGDVTNHVSGYANANTLTLSPGGILVCQSRPGVPVIGMGQSQRKKEDQQRSFREKNSLDTRVPRNMFAQAAGTCRWLGV